MQGNTRLRRGVLSGLGLAVFAYALIVFYAGWNEIALGLARVDARLWALLLALTALHFALRFWRWRLYLSLLGHRPPLGANLLIYLSGFALTATPGKIGETWRGLYLAERGVPFSDPTAAFIAERYTDLAALLALSALGLGLYTGEVWPLVLLLGLLAVGLSIVQHPRLPALLERWGAGGRLEPIAAGLARMLRVSAQLLTAPVMAVSLIVSALAWGAQGVMLWLILENAGHDVALTVAMGAYAIALCAGALSFMPGGLGSMEAVLIALLVVAGLEGPDAAAVTIVVRLVTLWLAVLIGVAATAWLEIGKWSRRAAGRAPQGKA